MAKYMRQVVQEEFEILTRFHPGEVRFYVDTTKDIPRRTGTKVKISHPAVKTLRKVKPAKTTAPINKGVIAAANRGRFVQLGTKGGNGMKQTTVTYRVYSAANGILENDPTKAMKRTELTEQLVSGLPKLSKISQIVPAISTLIKKGNLRYTGA